MEAASKKRGRPSKFTDGELAELRRLYPEVNERQRQNLFYADKAKSVFALLTKLHVAKDPDKGRAFIDGHEWILQRRGILTKLGRILGKDWDPKKLKEVEEAWRVFQGSVNWLGEKRPNTKRAVAVLRRRRMGQAKPADEEELARKIAVMIIEYCTTHSCEDDMFFTRTLGMVRGALAEILASRRNP